MVPDDVIGPPEVVKPVVPPDTSTLETVPVVGVAQVGVPAPALVSTWPAVPTAVKSYAVPVPYETAPAIGVAVELVPPLAVANVPPNVIVPDDVMGPPDVVNPVVPPDTSTLVTVPVVGVAHPGEPAPLLVNICPGKPTVVNLYDVPSPYAMAPDCGVDVEFVPPFAIGVTPVPAPVMVYRFSKNRYHSREINPVVGSITGTRGGVILVVLGGLAISARYG